MEESLYIHSEDREILRGLYKAQGPLELSYFHERYLLSPGQLARVIRKYASMGVLAFEEGKIYLTEIGYRFVISKRGYIFGRATERIWEEIPDEFRMPIEPMTSYYIPNEKDLNKLLKESMRRINL
jgi:hypothetical protein